MFELCDLLVGIYKTFNCTKSVSVDPKAFGDDDAENAVVPNALQNNNVQVDEQNDPDTHDERNLQDSAGNEQLADNTEEEDEGVGELSQSQSQPLLESSSSMEEVVEASSSE